MKTKLAGAVCLGATVACSAIAAAQAPLLAPYRLSESFDGGSVGAWSSYPPAQDTAYDPTIWVKPLVGERATADRALYREITPLNPVDYEFGVRKLVHLHVDQTSVLTFRAYVDAANGTSGMRLRFGFADGSDETVDVPFTTTRAWVEGRVELDAVVGAGPPRELTAIAFIAMCPEAAPGAPYRFGLDDVTLTGWRPPVWTFVDPPAHELVELREAVAGRHFQYGDTLRLHVRAPVSVERPRLHVSRALTGGDPRVIEMSGGGRDWRAEITLSETAGVGAGLWRAALEAETPDGRRAASSLVFLVRRADAPIGHPRLLLGPGDAEQVLARAATGHLADVWERIQDEAARLRREHDWRDFDYNFEAYDAVHWLPTLSGYSGTLRTVGRYIRDNAVVHALGGEPEAGEAARQALLKVAAWPTYVHPHILAQGQFTYWPAGLALIDFAVGFDLVHALMTPDERRVVADALVDKGVTQVAREYVEDNRVSSNTSNWISHVTGGGILGALAAADEIPDTRLEPHLTGMILKLGAFLDATYDPDGAYGEGYSYANFTMQTLGEIMPALERTFGIEFPDKVGRSHEFLLHQMTPSGRLLDFGDTTDRPASFTNFAYLIGRSRDPRLKWLYDRSPGMTDRDLFFLDPDVEPRPPGDLPRAMVFREVGTAVFRTGFGAEDFTLVFRCGPFYNHQHFDQGAFHLVDRGEALVTEVGRTDYYNDPQYQRLAIQAAGHSTILIDDNPESQRAGDLRDDVPAWRSHAVMTDFLSWDDGGFASCDLGSIYKGAVESLQRDVLWLAPRVVLLVDRARGADSAERINLRFHAPALDDIRVDGRVAEIAGTNARLELRSLLPPDAQWETRRRPVTLDELGRADAVTLSDRGFLQLDADLGSGAEPVTLVTLLSAGRAPATATVEVEATDHLVVVVDGRRYVINRTPGEEVVVGELRTDARLFASAADALLIVGATRATRQGERLLSADATVSVLVDGEGRVSVSTLEASRVELALDREPTAVRVNGTATDRWTYDPASGLSVTLTDPSR